MTGHHKKEKRQNIHPYFTLKVKTFQADNAARSEGNRHPEAIRQRKIDYSQQGNQNQRPVLPQKTRYNVTNLDAKDNSAFFIRKPISIKSFPFQAPTPDFFHGMRPAGDGSNFGLSKDGTRMDGVFSEHRETLQKYAVEPRKYRKDYIDRAKAQVDARQHATRVAAEGTGYYGMPRYGILRHNCRRYVVEILRPADEFARKDGMSLVID